MLDNFHSGYVSILVETGLIGFALLLALGFSLGARLQELLRATSRANRLSLEMTAVFLVMFITINLTETYLSRSTNFLALLFTFLVVKVFEAPMSQQARRAALGRRLMPEPAEG